MSDEEIESKSMNKLKIKKFSFILFFPLLFILISTLSRAEDFSLPLHSPEDFKLLLSTQDKPATLGEVPSNLSTSTDCQYSRKNMKMIDTESLPSLQESTGTGHL